MAVGGLTDRDGGPFSWGLAVTRNKVRRPKWIHPPEASGIAAQFRSAANQARRLAGILRATRGVLDATWEGNAKNSFFSAFQTEPEALEGYAAWLDERARSVESMAVKIYEEVWE